jgi:hypothetical protein
LDPPDGGFAGGVGLLFLEGKTAGEAPGGVGGREAEEDGGERDRLAAAIGDEDGESAIGAAAGGDNCAIPFRYLELQGYGRDGIGGEQERRKKKKSETKLVPQGAWPGGEPP